MITRNNIAELYEKYRKNLEKEEYLNGSMLKSGDEESWLLNLQKKSSELRRIYTENEAMLNLYLRPLLQQEMLMTDELAEELYEQLLIMNANGYCDRVMCVEAGEALLKYLEKQNKWEKWIRICHILGGFYSRYSNLEDTEKSLKYFGLERECIAHYAEIEDWDIRRGILFSFYNYAVVWNNSSVYRKFADREQREEYLQRVIRETDWAISVYDDGQIRALDGERYDLDELKEELSYDIFGSFICGCSKKSDFSAAMLERSGKVIESLYENAQKDCPEKFQIPDEIYCNYWKMEYFLNNISLEKYIQMITEYCDFVLEHGYRQEDMDFIDSRYFQVNMYHIPNLVSVDGVKNDSEIFEKVKAYVLPRFRNFVEHLPRSENSVFINGPLWEAITDLAENVGTEEIDIYYFLNILLNRNENLAIDAAMVKRLSLSILQKILDRKPELLVGTAGYKSVVEVLEHREQLELILTQAALLYDVGKGKAVDEVGTTDRRLEESEKEVIRYHAQDGYEILKSLHFDDTICDIARGHHRYYDGTGGYPENYDNTSSRARFLTDLIYICDSMNAATDSIGRSYRKAKNFEDFVEELRLGAGIQYNPDIVALILEEEELYRELFYQCSAGRTAVCYEIYHDFISSGTEQAVERHLEETEDDTTIIDDAFLALAQSMLFIGRIRLGEDILQVIHSTKDGLWEEAAAGSFRKFIDEFCRKYMHPEDYPKIERFLEYSVFKDSLLAMNGSMELEARFRTEEQAEWVWVRLHFLVAEEQAEIPRLVIMTVRDIDIIKKQQQQWKIAMELAHEQAEEASRAKSAFLSHMSHDMRTPMNIILGMTQLARNHLDDRERVEDCITKIDQASTHLLGLVNEVLDMSKIESGKMELDCRPVSLRKIIQEAIAMTQEGMEKKHISCKVDVGRLPEENVFGDEIRIREVVLNLISNAVKYTPEGKWIAVFAEKLEEKTGEYGSYRLIVKDGGIGISEEFLQKLFEPFTREQREETSNITGTGLGLSITKSIVELMHGYIHVDSTEGVGSEFEVVIRLKAAEDFEDREKDQKITPEACRNRFVGRRILLAEDNELNREIFAELVRDTGVMIDVAENGVEAVQKVEQAEDGYYGMVFMDAQMPLMDGYEATRKIRAWEQETCREHHLPIVALSANVFAEDVNAAMQAGMDIHLGKPLELTKILAVMVRWLEE